MAGRNLTVNALSVPPLNKNAGFCNGSFTSRRVAYEGRAVLRAFTTSPIVVPLGTTITFGAPVYWLKVYEYPLTLMVSRIRSVCPEGLRKISNLTTKKAPLPLLFKVIVAIPEGVENDSVSETITIPYCDMGMGRLLIGGAACTAIGMTDPIIISSTKTAAIDTNPRNLTTFPTINLPAMFTPACRNLCVFDS